MTAVGLSQRPVYDAHQSKIFECGIPIMSPGSCRRLYREFIRAKKRRDFELCYQPPSETAPDLADFHQRQGHAPRFAGKGREIAPGLCRMGRYEGPSTGRLGQGRTARVGEALGCLKNFDLRALPESHTRIISICSDEASPNSTAREPDDTPCATTRGRTYRQSSRAGGRASTNMVEVLNPTVREPWQKLKENFMN